MPWPYKRAAAPILLPVFFLLNPGTADAGDSYVSIIIDDLGNSALHAEDVLGIPGPVTLAILPHTRYGASLAKQAFETGKEVMLHLPMQSVEHHHHTAGTLTLHMTPTEFRQQLESNIESIPHIRGMNNHMGSLLTQHPGYMELLMDYLSKQPGLYFVDSKTTLKTVASRFADRYRVPNRARDIFLDPDYRPDTIRHQFRRLIETARRSGYAIGIAHPHPRTIEFIRNNIGQLEQHGIELVPVSAIIEQQDSTEVESDVACTGAACTGL